MGLFDALTTAVSGLSAQSYALQNISGNIANSQTTAFKRLDTRFEDLMGDNLPSKQVAGGVMASSDNPTKSKPIVGASLPLTCGAWLSASINRTFFPPSAASAAR